jgi:cysteinyl-tRNA synthetase
MNLTDVDDKTIKGATEAGKPLREYVQHYIDAFHEDRRYLRIKDASVYPRATDYIGPMVAMVEGLLKRGVAYKGEDGSVYFSIARFPPYGRLSRLDTRELKAGGGDRVSSDEYSKEDVRDFALWKAAKLEDEKAGAAWDAPFGRGRPGWHLECSAMALALIGGHWGTDILDIHAGGVDLIFPHHEDEIAQSCAFTGKAQFARYWLHGEFLDIEGTKMSKRYGNILTPRDLRDDGVPAEALRLLMFGTHYRKKLDWSDEALAAAREGSHRLGEFQNRLAGSMAASDTPRFVAAAGQLERDLTEALDDDLNAPRAVAAMFAYLNEGNAALDAGERPGPAAIAAWEKAEGVLGVTSKVVVMKVKGGGSKGLTAESGQLSENPPTEPGAAESWAREWAARRARSKTARDYAEADRIRALLSQHGFQVRDSRDGSIEVVRTALPKA